MPLYTTDALILRTYKLGESDRIVVFLTRDRGKKRGVAKNARQSRRRFGGGLEPMTVGRVGYVERERRDLVRLEYVEPKRSPMAAADREALGYVGYFAELVDEWAQENDPNANRPGVALFQMTAARKYTIAAQSVSPAYSPRAARQGVLPEPLARRANSTVLPPVQRVRPTAAARSSRSQPPGSRCHVR